MSNAADIKDSANEDEGCDADFKWSVTSKVGQLTEEIHGTSIRGTQTRHY